MARYYYERYTVRSSTTYRWDRYTAESTYMEGSWSAPLSQGEKSAYDGWSAYTFDEKTGYFSNSGSNKIIYPENATSNGPYVYRPLLFQILNRYYFDSREGNNTLWANSKTSSFSHYRQGEWGGTTYGRYSQYENNARNSDGYWYVRGSSSTSNYRGTYIDTIVAEDGTYPDNGRVGTSYWYVKTGKAFPEFKVRQNGQLKTSVDGWVRVNGVLKQIQQIWVRVNGSLKEV